MIPKRAKRLMQSENDILSSKKFELEKAIGENRLTLLFQPRISAKTMQMIGVEGLLRWHSDDKGWVAVDALANFSINEHARLWTWKLLQLEKVFNLLKEQRWQPSLSNPDFSISLNLSSKQLHSDDWAVQLLQTIAKAGVPGICVEVELEQEGDPLNTSFIEWSFNAIRNAGVLLTLDGFLGNGKNVLKLLSYKFDKVKIDRSIIPSAHDSAVTWSKKKQRLEGNVSLINSVGADVVLKGIEKKNQLNYFQGLNITEWQGFYWGEAIEFDSILPKIHSLNRQEVIELSSGNGKYRYRHAVE